MSLRAYRIKRYLRSINQLMGELRRDAGIQEGDLLGGSVLGNTGEVVESGDLERSSQHAPNTGARLYLLHTARSGSLDSPG